MPTGWMGGWHADATWLGWAGSRIVSIGQMRPGLTTLAIGLGVLAIVEAVHIFHLHRRTGGSAGLVETRLDKLAEALNLLADTTESGLTALAVEVQRAQLRAASPRAGSRGAGARTPSAKSRSASGKMKAAPEALSEDAAQLQAALAMTMSAHDVAESKGL